MLLKILEIFNNNNPDKATVGQEPEHSNSVKYVFCLHFASSLVKNFLSKTVYSSLPLKLSLPVFLNFCLTSA